MGNRYDGDLVAWAYEQAAHLRNRNWSALDLGNLAEEIEAVARAEQRALRSRMAVTLAHLLKWTLQPAMRSKSWLHTLRTQRKRIAKLVHKMPSLAHTLQDADWYEEAWEDAVELARRETGLDDFPEACPWTVAQALDEAFLPD